MGIELYEPDPQQMSPIATLATSNVGRWSGGTGGFGTLQFRNVLVYVVVPPTSPSFVYRNYTATTVLTQRRLDRGAQMERR